ncbi:unnamed protein product, partial [Prorocentrum cordatum]
EIRSCRAAVPGNVHPVPRQVDVPPFFDVLELPGGAPDGQHAAPWAPRQARAPPRSAWRRPRGLCAHSGSSASHFFMVLECTFGLPRHPAGLQYAHLLPTRWRANWRTQISVQLAICGARAVLDALLFGAKPVGAQRRRPQAGWVTSFSQPPSPPFPVVSSVA